MPERTEEFEDLVRGHARLMAAAIRRVCGRRHAALVPDVEQEVHLALWKRLGSGNEIRHPASYVYRVALLTALAVVRRNSDLAQSLDDPDGPSSEEPAAPEPDGLAPAERTRLLREVLASVEPDEARALRAYLAGFDHVEVARLYGWTESVARHRIYRTLDRLRAQARESAGGGKTP